MTEDAPATPEAGAAAEPKQAPVNMRVLTQYIRDLSFENVLSQKGATPDVKPEVNVQVALDAKKRNVENQYEVIIKMDVKSADGDTTLFIIDLEYAGIFHIENIPEDQLHPFLMIECPRQLFPFLRRIVSDMTRDGGFPALNLEQIDFVSIYRNEITRRLQAQKAAAEGKVN